MFVVLTNPGKRELVYQTTATISSTWSATGIHSRTLTTLRHLLTSRALRRTLRTACLAESTVTERVVRS